VLLLLLLLLLLQDCGVVGASKLLLLLPPPPVRVSSTLQRQLASPVMCRPGNSSGCCTCAAVVTLTYASAAAC
jgi:hypothetical protein